MSELRDLMEEARRRNPAPAGAFDRLARRRARRQRNERLLAGAVALVLAGVAVWGASRAFLHPPPVRPAGRLSPQTAHTLRRAWTTRLPSVSFSVPVAAGGRIFESDAGSIEGIDAATGRILFSGRVGARATTPAVLGDTVYVASQSSLVAFRVACAGSCRASWRATVTGGPLAALVGAPGGDELIALGTDGSLRAYAATCGSAGARCLPLWTASEGTFTASAPPIVDATSVYALTTEGTALRFPLTCGGAGASCQPAWRGRAPSGAPRGVAASAGVVVVATSAGAAAFGAGCAQGGASCLPLWQATVPGGVAGAPAAAEGVVVIGSGDGVIYGFPLRCRPAQSGCRPAWHSPAGLNVAGAPAITGGMVLLATSDGRLHALPVRCPASTCGPLWSATMQRDRVPAGGPIVSGTVVIGISGNRMVGYAPGGR